MNRCNYFASLKQMNVTVLLLLIFPSCTSYLFSQVRLSNRCKIRGDRAFGMVVPKLWNKVPLHIKQASSKAVFKLSLKSRFYSLAMFLLLIFMVLLFYLLFLLNQLYICFIILHYTAIQIHVQVQEALLSSSGNMFHNQQTHKTCILEKILKC